MKFFIALILALAVCGFATAQGTPVGGYNPITFNPNNKNLVAILDFGVDQAIPLAIASGQISEGEWNWTNVVSAQVQVVAGMNYDFIVDIEDDSGDTTRLNVIVFVAPGGKSMSLSSWGLLMLQDKN